MSNWKQMSDQYGYTVDCTPNSELITTDKIRLVGAIFNGAVLDANFWSNRVATGTVTEASSEAILTSGTADTHRAEMWSVRRANWVTGTSMKFRAQLRFGDTGTANVVRRWGRGYVSGSASTLITDGACFRLNGTALSIVTHANSTSGTEVASASFNGTYTAPTFTNNNTYEILYTLGKVYFLIGNVIVHTVNASTTHWTSNTTNFHAFADVVNTGNSAAVTMTIRMMNITRLGKLETAPTYKHITTNTTTLCKRGGGILHKVSVNDPTNNKITIYDDIAATAGTEIAIIDPDSSATPFTLDYHVPFNIGLTIVTAGTPDLTIVYE